MGIAMGLMACPRRGLRRVVGPGLLMLIASACGGVDDGTSQGSEEGLTASSSLSDDSYVTTVDPTVVRGARTYLKVGTSSTVTQRAYLKFNVSGIPSGATNVKATLTLQALQTITETIEAHAAKSTSFSEGSLVLANEPGEQATVLSSVSGTTQGQAQSWDVSGAVTGNGTFGIVLSSPSGAPVELASKESTTPPKLVVTYTKAPALATKFGAAYNPHNSTTLASLVSAFGGVQVIRSYDGGSGVGPFLNTYQAQDIAAGAASSYSFKYQPSEVIAGKHDADLKSFFQGIQDGHVVYWTYWHEPDDEIFKSHTFTASDYRAAWAHIRSIADGVKATRPKLQIFATLIIMEYSMSAKVAPTRPLTGPDGMYPGDNVIDIFGVDAYDSAAPQSISPVATEFDPVIAFAKAHNKPWAIGELGSCSINGNAQGRATWMKNALSYWKSQSSVPVFAAWFDVDWSTCDYRIENDAPAAAVWKDAVTKGYSAF
jgi:hypothetical protein